MFYKTGIDITNDKQMFNFLKNHFEYSTMNSWNRLSSIANNVKLYNLDLSGDWNVALSMLENGEYETLSWVIRGWERANPGYSVYFNGRNGGYLVLTNERSATSILPDSILDNDTYEDYKEWCRDEYGSVRANRAELVEYTKLVQSFDRLCDELRAYCDGLSNLNFEIVEMEKAVNDFNEDYADDLEAMEFDELHCDSEGIVDISEISMLKSLYEAFIRMARRDYYHLDFIGGGKVKLVSDY